MEKLLDFFINEQTKSKTELDKLIPKLISDINYNFPWIGEDIYKLNHRITTFDYLIKSIKDSDQNNVTIETIKEYLTNKVLNSNKLMERSSGQLHALVSLWNKEVYIEILEEINWNKLRLTF